MENLPEFKPMNEMKVGNPKTKAVHRRDFWVQILLPMLIFIIGFAALIIWLVINKVGTSEIWADITVIVTFLPFLIIGLILLTFSIGLIYLITVINREIPPLTFRTQKAIFKIKGQVGRGADISAMPVIQVRSFLAIIDAFFALFKGKL
jgi:hypothetical protein